MIIIDAPSPNFGPRKEDTKVKYLVLHYTGSPTAFEALRLLQGGDPAHEVSAHYLIDETGGVTRLVDESMRAWHAGKSCWEGETDINSCSIGIEIQNPGHEYGYVPFPDAQMAAVTKLCLEIIARHKILPQYVLAHSDIAPERKKDPGELFPWEELAKQGIGLWPETADNNAEETDDIKSALVRYGYDTRLDTQTLVAAFQRHFEPEAFLDNNNAGAATPATAHRLQALIRQKLAGRPKIK